jgi:hypothetical protein
MSDETPLPPEKTGNDNRPDKRAEDDGPTNTRQCLETVDIHLFKKVKPFFVVLCWTAIIEGTVLFLWRIGFGRDDWVNYALLATSERQNVRKDAGA